MVFGNKWKTIFFKVKTNVCQYGRGLKDENLLLIIMRFCLDNSPTTSANNILAKYISNIVSNCQGCLVIVIEKGFYWWKCMFFLHSIDGTSMVLTWSTISFEILPTIWIHYQTSENDKGFFLNQRDFTCALIGQKLIDCCNDKSTAIILKQRKASRIALPS